MPTKRKINAPLRNNYPCCRNSTRLHNIEQYEAGDVIEATCGRCEITWVLEFKAVENPSILRASPGKLKIEWTRKETP